MISLPFAIRIAGFLLGTITSVALSRIVHDVASKKRTLASAAGELVVAAGFLLGATVSFLQPEGDRGLLLLTSTLVTAFGFALNARIRAASR